MQKFSVNFRYFLVSKKLSQKALSTSSSANNLDMYLKKLYACNKIHFHERFRFYFKNNFLYWYRPNNEWWEFSILQKYTTVPKGQEKLVFKSRCLTALCTSGKTQWKFKSGNFNIIRDRTSVEVLSRIKKEENLANLHTGTIQKTL